MSKILDAANEALAIAKGDIPAARITINGHAYVPENFATYANDCVDAARAEINELKNDLGAALVRENNALAEIERLQSGKPSNV